MRPDWPLTARLQEFKLVAACGNGPPTAAKKVIGEPNTTMVSIEGQGVTALLDTGATVSIIKESIATQLGLSIEPVTDFVRIECANGQLLPYIGYAIADIALQIEIPPKQCVLLVTPDANSQSIPIILGTNSLEELLDSPIILKGPLMMAAKCIEQRKKQLLQNNGTLSLLRYRGPTPITLAPNTMMALPVSADECSDYPVSHVLVEETPNSNLPGDIEVSPSVQLFKDSDTKFKATIANTSIRTMNIIPGAIIAQISPVTLSDTKNDVEVQSLLLPDLTSSEATPIQRQKLQSVFESHTDVFSQGDHDLGYYNGVKHRIDLSDDRPFKQRYRRIPPHMFEEVADHIKQLEASGIIRPSRSQYSSPVVCVRKKDGKLRLCVDFRLLNSKTIKDNYCLPRVEEILDSLQGARYFSKLDLKSGYHQVEINEAHKERTAFTVGPLGFWEHNRLAFGLCNSPATFQRCIEHCFADINLKSMFIYIDDIIVFSNSFEEHLEKLTQVFERLRLAGLKLAPKKCEILKPSISFLGYIVSKEGISTDPEKIAKVLQWPIPKNADELRSYLGFCGYYRKFVKQYSNLVRPLIELLPPTNTTQKKPKVKQNWHWNDNHQEAFDKIKRLLCSAPILAYADFQKPFEVHVDASGDGLGAVLYQEHDKMLRPISYASRTLTKAERCYPTHKREFLGLKWAITQKFNDYLWGAPKFKVKTDNNPLTYVLTTAKLDSAGHRWLAALAAFDFEIQYTPGISNKDADGLSRIPHQTIDISSVQAACNMTFAPFAHCMGIHVADEDEEDPSTPFPNISINALRKAQNNDEILSVWITALRTKRFPRLSNTPNAVKHGIMKKNWHKLVLQRGLMYRDTGESRQLVLPQKYVTMVCEALHDDCGHQGIEKTQLLIKQRFFWPRMTVDISDWVENCGRCIRFKKRPDLAPLVGIQTSEPMELVCTDFLKVDAAEGGTQYILVITDHFTRFAKAIPTRNMSAKTTAEALLSFIQNFGVPKRLHSDQGANFESKVIQELCLLLGIEKSRTTPYHPMGNGSCERMNQTLIRMLGTLPEVKKNKWPKHIGMLTLAYNSTPHDSTGFSPFFLMFGRLPRLGIDQVFPSNPRQKPVEDVKEALKWAWSKASENDTSAKQKSKKYYDRRVKGATLITGDRVLVKECAFDGPHKLKDKWSKDIYTVVDKPNEGLPIFKVKAESGGRIRTLHRNLLLPVQSIRDESHPTLVNEDPPNPEALEKIDECSEESSITDNDSEQTSESDEEDEEIIMVPAEAQQETGHDQPDNTVTATETLQPQTPPTPAPRTNSTPIPLRRSSRVRVQPEQLRSGDFVLSITNRVNFLIGLLENDFVDKTKITEAIVSLVLNVQ